MESETYMYLKERARKAGKCVMMFLRRGEIDIKRISQLSRLSAIDEFGGYSNREEPVEISQSY